MRFNYPIPYDSRLVVNYMYMGVRVLISVSNICTYVHSNTCTCMYWYIRICTYIVIFMYYLEVISMYVHTYIHTYIQMHCSMSYTGIRIIFMLTVLYLIIIRTYHSGWRLCCDHSHSETQIWCPTRASQCRS